jgi:hypothetical protein
MSASSRAELTVIDALTTSIVELRTASPTAAKSLPGSYGRLPRKAGLIATAPTVVNSRVVPSGSERATYSAAIAPFAPGLFSTTTL